MALKKTKSTRPWLILPGLAIGVILLSSYRRSLKPLGPILARMRLRGQDQHGYGYFGASRSGGSRQHNGIDLVCTPGEAVFSPVRTTTPLPLKALLLHPPEKQGFTFSPKPNPTATSSHPSLNPAIFSSILPIFLKFFKSPRVPFAHYNMIVGQRVIHYQTVEGKIPI